MNLALHEANGGMGVLPGTTEYITFIEEMGSSFFATVRFFRRGRRKCLVEV